MQITLPAHAWNKYFILAVVRSTLFRAELDERARREGTHNVGIFIPAETRIRRVIEGRVLCVGKLWKRARSEELERDRREKHSLDRNFEHNVALVQAAKVNSIEFSSLDIYSRAVSEGTQTQESQR